MKIIRIAEEQGINMQVGGFLESRLGFTASAHLALASEQIHYYDLDSPLFFTADPVVGGIQYGDNGEVTMPDQIGLGATIDNAWLKEIVMINS